MVSLRHEAERGRERVGRGRGRHHHSYASISGRAAAGLRIEQMIETTFGVEAEAIGAGGRDGRVS